jgi:hypothetical protein
MTFNESFEREAVKMLDQIAALLEKREWDHGLTGNEETRIALRDVRLAIVEVSTGMRKSE